MSAGMVHVFYLASNNTLAYKWYDPGSGSWSGQQSVDSTRLTGAPAVASSAGSRLDVFVRNSDGTISYRKWYGLWAPTWNNLGYSQTSNVAVASWGTGRMDIVFRGTNNDMRHFAFGG